jgi:hypothetical protein
VRCPTAQFRQFAVLAVPWALADFVAPVTTKLPETPRAAFDAAHAELRQLICKGFEEGITREKLAEVAGLSLARVYQIRDGAALSADPGLLYLNLAHIGR